ncbi:hypothetical protein JW916_02735 [Candidatus Sumerlaeota bacterium]|nr:hypothetical protein [Candidatus Sumerlaeota bacterium]
MVSLSNLQLENVLVNSIRAVSVRPSRVPKSIEKVKIDIGVTYDSAEIAESPNRFLGRLTVTIKPDPTSCTAGAPVPDMEMSVEGTFSILGEPSDDVVRVFKEQSAPAMLYGVCRGIALMITGVMPTGRVNWPTLNMTTLNTSPKPPRVASKSDSGARRKVKPVAKKRIRSKERER